MEISSSPPHTDLERENMVSWRDQEAEELNYPECLEIQQSSRDQQKDDMTMSGIEDGERDGDECDYLVFETAVQKEEIKMDESDGRQKSEEEGKEEKENTDKGGKTNRENEITNQAVSENGSIGCERRESQGEDEHAVKDTRQEKVAEGTTEDAGSGEAEETEKWVNDVKADSLEEFCFPSKSPECHLSSLEASNPLDSSETPAVTTLQEDWAEDPTHPDDLSDCLQAELAIVYSDSDAGDDQWASFSHRDITNQTENCGAISDGNCDGESKVEERGEENVLTLAKENEADKKRGGGEERRDSVRHNYDDEEQMRTRRGVFLRSPSASSTPSSIDPERRVKHVTCISV